MAENQKTKILYDKYSPYTEGTTFVAIQAETKQPYVWCTYFKSKGEIPILPSDILVVPVKTAKNLFDFQKGKLEEMVRF